MLLMNENVLKKKEEEEELQTVTWSAELRSRSKTPSIRNEIPCKAKLNKLILQLLKIRPLVMMSSGSLHSSSTLLASSPNNSICEVTDIDTDCPSEVDKSEPAEGTESESGFANFDYNLDPPQVSISSHDSPEHQGQHLDSLDVEQVQTCPMSMLLNGGGKEVLKFRLNLKKSCNCYDI